MTVDEVQRWYVDWFKINHVVLREERGWVTTLCGDYTTGEGQSAPSENKAGKARVCSKCRKRLPVAILAGEKPGVGGEA